MPRPGQRLSELESRVLAHKAAGLTEEQMAKRMSLAVSTVKTTMRRVLAKTGTSNAAGAVARAVRRGELDLEHAAVIEQNHR